MTKLFILIRLRRNLFLNTIRLKKCVIKQFIDVFVFDSIPGQYKNQEMYDIVVSLYRFLIAYYLDKYITQRIWDEDVDNSPAALKLFPDWFVISKMIKKAFTVLYADDGLLFFDEDSGDVTFYCNKMGILSVNLNNIILDNNFDEDGPDTIILIRLFAWKSKFKKHKALKNDKLRINANRLAF